MGTARRPRRFNALLSSIYENPKAAASFGSPYRLYQAAKERDRQLTLKDVHKWLSTRDAYTKHRETKIRFPRRKILCRSINYLWQADLVDYEPIADVNSGTRYLMTVIDCFSRYAVAVPMKNKDMRTSTQAFLKVMRATKSKPKKLQTDRGSEFKNKLFKKMLREHKIHLYHTHTEIKAAIVERFNRTLRSRIQKFMVTNNTLRYIDVLPDLVLGYNKTIHSSLEKYSPEQVTKKNEREVFNIQYGEYLAKRKKLHKLNIGDKVRITLYRSIFKKGHEQNFSDELYTIVDTLFTQPPTYILKSDIDGEIVKAPFYEEEIQLVTEP